MAAASLAAASHTTWIGPRWSEADVEASLVVSSGRRQPSGSRRAPNTTWSGGRSTSGRSGGRSTGRKPDGAAPRETPVPEVSAMIRRGDGAPVTAEVLSPFDAPRRTGQVATRPLER